MSGFLGLPLIRRAIIAACCLVLVTGCSALRLGYTAAPDLGYWWFDRYVDFTSTQSTRVRAAIAQWFAWHKREQLPEYSMLLVRAQAEVVADVTPARVCEWQAELVRRAETAFDRAVPAVADLALSVTPQQIANIERRYAKTNEEYRDEYLQPDPARRSAATLKRVVDRAETLYGSLNEGQRARLAADLARSPFDPELWFAERRQRQRDTLEVLRRLTQDRATPEQAQSAVRAYAARILHSPREAYERYAERVSSFNCVLAATLHNGTGSAQRQHAQQVLAGWEGDLRAIVARIDVARPE